MQFRILGSIEAVESGTTLPLKGPRLRLLLAVLLAHAGERVSTGYLLNAFWGDTPPGNARSLLQVRISELRHALSPDPRNPFAGLVTHSSGYQITVNSPDDLDSWAFERLVGQGQNSLVRSEFLDAYRTLGQALALWRGSPFQEFENQPFGETQSAHLTALYLQAVEDRLAAALALGRHNEVAAEARPLVAKYPLREGSWFQLMLAQYRGGRQAEALQSYEVVRDLPFRAAGNRPWERIAAALPKNSQARSCPHP
ncbi:AfsR/SARP family transcriptional regulator [Pseudarthrobacter sulfonivorans]|uniref:AfsR/SARP family transcriptional regulator n=1 Tax=Pseudarthrobacter sulfonivorans TaxID=121292 RepID=UPI0009F8CBCA